jgi:pilus assembly protein CpaB
VRKSLVPLLIAIVLGLGAALFARNWMKSRMEAVEAEKRTGVQVVVAATEISFGQKFTAANTKTIGWPRDSQPEGVVHEAADIIGKVANQKILPGEAILKGRASGGAGGSSLAALIEPGMRAVTVRVNDVIGVAGFLLPGNRVDVVASRDSQGERNRVQTRTILEDVKVLAVDQSAQAEKDKPVVVRAVTLEVNPKQAELLVQATEEGKVQMALRNPEEAAPVVTAAVAPPAPAIVPVAPVRTKIVVVREPAPPPEPGVTVIRQTQVGESKD